VSTSPPRALDVGDNRNVLGRALDADVVLSIPEVSRHHALVVRRDNEVLLSDIDSANGTALNGARIGRAPVAIVPGDRISFGDAEFTFRFV
jgi:pSer/pThr/pTyr-binding forkhead associated (FHA) protein